MKAKLGYLALSLLGVMLALSSCRDLSLEPVFYALSQEQPLAEDLGFPDEVPVFRIVRFTAGVDDYYLAAANRLYLRNTQAGQTWAAVAPPVEGALCNTLEIFGGALYAGFYNSSNGTGYGLYTAAFAASPAWTPVAAMQDVEIVLLKSVGAQLFVATNANTGNLNRLYYGDGTTFTEVTWTLPQPTDVAFVDAESFGGSYWVLVGAYLYQAAGLPGPFVAYSGGTGLAPVSPLGTHPVSGGLFAGGGALYLSAGNGHLYRTTDGADWTRSADPYLDDDEDFPTRFTSFVAPTADAGAVYVGTRGQGYFRLPGGDVAADPDTVTRPPYNVAALYTGALNCLLYDGAATPPRLLLGTSGSGLWRGDHIGGSDWSWKQE